MHSHDTPPPIPLILVHKGVLTLGALIAMWLTDARAMAGYPWMLAGYFLLSLGLLWVIQRWPRARRWGLSTNYTLDMALTLAVIRFSGGLSSPFWMLLLIQVLLPAFYFPWAAFIWVGAFLSGPLYALAIWSHSQSLAFLRDPLFLTRYALLFVGAIAGALAVQQLIEAQERERRLRNTLATREADLAAQTKQLQRTASDLGDRVLQLRALQEVARSLTVTLNLRETNRALIKRLSTITDARHVALMLLHPEERVLQGSWLDTKAQPRRLAPITLHITEHDIKSLSMGVPVFSPVSKELGFDQLHALWGVKYFLSMPLMLRGAPMGALYLGDHRHDFVTEQERQFLESFAYFASTAIENAELYQTISDKKQELETILAGIGDGVLVVDSDLRVVLMNPVATRIFNLPSPPPSGAPLPDLIRQEPIYDLLDEIRRQPKGSRMQEIELSPRGSNQIRTYQALATPLIVGNALQGIATVLRDITTQKELERMKSNFLSVVSHELRTPLHSIKGFVDIILMGKTGPVTEIQRDFLETVQEQTNNLQRLIDDLLEFSRMESGRITLHLKPVDMPVVIEAVVDKLALSAHSARVTLVNQTPEDLPTIMADPWRLEQVVTNLMDNAIKFTQAGGSVTIWAEDIGDYIQVSVRDTGIGIPPEQQVRIFDRFYQVDSGANRQYKGTGLGLTICRHIVEHHRGRIWVESEPGQGATFHFTVYKHLEEGDIGALDFTTLPQQQAEDKPSGAHVDEPDGRREAVGIHDPYSVISNQ